MDTCTALCSCEETGCWEFSTDLPSQVDSKGRRQLMRLPPVDAQMMRRSVEAGILKFRSVLGEVSDWCPLSDVEQEVGMRFAEALCRVWLCNRHGPPCPWPCLPEPPALVTADDGNHTSVSTALRRLHSLVAKGDDDLPQIQNSCAGVAILGDALKIQSLSRSFEDKPRNWNGGRRNNGFEYSPKSMLNAVRLSDEIKDLSRMKEVAVQVFKMFLSDELVQHLTTQARFRLERGHGENVTTRT